MINKKDKNNRPKFHITIEGEENTDWIKLIDDGKYQETDLAASDEATEIEQERHEQNEDEE